MPIKLHQVVFIKRSDVFLAKQERFWNFHVFLKKKQVEEILQRQSFTKYLRLIPVLAQFPLATSEMEVYKLEYTSCLMSCQTT